MVAERRLSREERKNFIQLRRNFNAPVIGITGHVGKTTTREMICSVLSHHGKVLKHHHGKGNWKNNIHTLEKLSPEFDYAIFEFDFESGNRFGEILRLIKPNIGLVTNIGDAHLSYLGGMINIALSRSEIVKYLARDGVAILNKDDELSSTVSQYITSNKVIKFGLNQNGEYFASDIEHLGPLGTRFTLNNSYSVNIPVYSIPDVYNFLSATAALVQLGFSIEEIVETFQSNFSLPPGRGKMYRLNGYYILDESYGASMRSVAKATRSLVGFKPHVEKLIVIIGDMIESGPNVEEVHLNMGYFISALPIDCVITVGNYAHLIGKGVSLIQSREKMVINCNSINDILRSIKPVIGNSAVILVQGIGQVGTHRIIKFLENGD